MSGEPYLSEPVYGFDPDYDTPNFDDNPSTEAHMARPTPTTETFTFDNAQEARDFLASWRFERICHPSAVTRWKAVGHDDNGVRVYHYASIAARDTLNNPTAIRVTSYTGGSRWGG